MVGEGDFIPHFVAREVKKRYEWVTSPDVEEKLAELRIEQEKVRIYIYIYMCACVGVCVRLSPHLTFH